MSTFSKDAFQRLPIIGILRGFSREETDQIVQAYLASGLTTIEITLNTPNALTILEDLVARYGTALNVGAGTVCTMPQLEKAFEAGAQFIVTPILDLPIIQRCREAGILVFPGAYTPTEIYRAWDAGAHMVKVFPASQLGPGYIKEVKAPLNDIQLLPTGGITRSNIGPYLEAGADGFGLGSSLFEQRHIAAGDWMALQRHFEKFAALFKKE